MGLEPRGLALFAFHLDRKLPKMAPVKGKIYHLATGIGFGEASEAHWVGQVIENDHHLGHQTQLCGPGGDGGEMPGQAGHDEEGPGMTREGDDMTWKGKNDYL